MAHIAPYGTVLCHYTTSAAAFDSILTERQLRFSPYSRMRDPFEAQPWRFAAAYFPDNFESREDEFQTYAQGNQEINELKFQTKLLVVDSVQTVEAHPTEATQG